MVGDYAIDYPAVIMARNISKFTSLELLTLPIGEGLVCEDGFGVGAFVDGQRFAWPAREFLQRGKNRFDNFGFCFDFEPCGTGGPGGVAAKCVLLGRRNVSGGSVC